VPAWALPFSERNGKKIASCFIKVLLIERFDGVVVQLQASSLLVFFGGGLQLAHA
jgi:hypothetical protein